MKKVLSYILLIFWLILIFLLSNQSGGVSATNSSSILYNVFNFIFSLLNIETSNLNEFINIIHEPLRELMHSFEYFVLGILFMNALYQSGVKENLFLISIMFCFIYSVSDELHQLFIEGRTLQYLDLFMDFIGYAFGSLLYNIFCKSKNNN